MNYNIEGEPLPVVICNLEANETMITEKGAMSWMTPNMKMETTSNGGIGKMFGRAFSGESMFQNRYTSMGGPGMIAFASCFPGCIRPFQIAPGQEIIAQKSAFLASTSGVELSVFFQKRIGAGFFGGEGFIMQRLSGNGLAFFEFDGHVVVAPFAQVLPPADLCQVDVVEPAEPGHGIIIEFALPVVGRGDLRGHLRKDGRRRVIIDGV